MSGCKVALTENIKQPTPYSSRQWDCLIDNINLYLNCGKASGCGNYPTIAKPRRPTLWHAQQVHDILVQIQPAIMGERPTMWSRNWLDRVVQTLRTGWPGCEGSSALDTVFELEIIPTIVPWMAELVGGACNNYPVFYFEPKNLTDFITIEEVPPQIIDQHKYRLSDYVEWRVLTEYSAAGAFAIYDFTTTPQQLIPAMSDPAEDTAVWYSFTRQNMLPFGDLSEDDFHFTATEFEAGQPLQRFPQNIAQQNAQILAAMQNMITPEAYSTVMMLSPYATRWNFIPIVSSYAQERSTWAFNQWAPLDTPIPEKLLVRVPTHFQVGDVEYPLAEHAQHLWALRWLHLRHLNDLQNGATSLMPTTGLPEGTQFQWVGAGNTLLRQRSVVASQWNFGGQVLRIDFGRNQRVWFATQVTHRPLADPCNGIRGAAGSTVAQAAKIVVISDGQQTPKCQDAWHY